MTPPDIDAIAIVGRLALAALLGGSIGLEREYDGQDAGFRTHLLVVLGAALFGLVSVAGFDAYVTGDRGSTNVTVDVTRVASYVAPGIGFIGGGAILKYGGRVSGITTAASLWSSAAVGLAVGLGFWVGAVAATVIVLVALEALEPLGRLAHRVGRRRRSHLTVTFTTGGDLDRLVAELQHVDTPIRRLRFGEGPDDHSVATVEFWDEPGNTDDVVRRVSRLDDVASVVTRWRR